MVTATGSLSDRAILRLARDLRACAWALEIGLLVLLASATLAFGAVHPWAYVPAWWLAGVLLVLLVCRAALAHALRLRIGPRRFCFHPSGLWLILDEESAYGLRTWSFDLARPLLPVTPLLLPGALFLAWCCAQLLLLPPGLVAWLSPTLDVAPDGAWRALSSSIADTRRGVAFVAWALAVHWVAAVVFDLSAARRRLRPLVVGFGCLVALFALGQHASGTDRIYGVFRPLDWQPGTRTLFGPFVNRNHFAAFANLLLPLALGLLAHAASRLRRRIGARANLRRGLIALQSPEGVRAVLAAVPALALLAALVACGSRGGLVAFAGGLLATAAVQRRSRPAAFVPVLLLGVVLTWYGTERIVARFRLTSAEAPGRTLVWRDALGRVPHYWRAGSGLNTFATAVSRATLWSLPRGATPWRAPYETSVAQAPRLGYRSLLGTPLLTWSSEAHNDYLQVLIETGVVGLLLALATLLAALWRARHDPWLLGGLSAVALHSLVDFPLQIPSLAALFMTLAALPGRPRDARPAAGPAAIE